MAKSETQSEPGAADAGRPARGEGVPGASDLAALSAAQARVPPVTAGFTGRRYGFLCGYCSSRLEATENMAGQSGACPTCGNTIVIPILDYRGRLIDPTTHEIIKQDPHPVHAYAAAGHRAPKIVTNERGERYIECPRCGRKNSLAGNNCERCGLPFTMEGTAGDALGGSNSLAVASLVLGIVSLMGGCVLAAVPPILAIIFGVLALRSADRAAGVPNGRGMAIAGLVLGLVAVVAAGIWALTLLARM